MRFRFDTGMVKAVLAGLAGAGILALILVPLLPEHPHSTAGVTVIGDNVAHVPPGETMLLYDLGTKWEITNDGTSVRFHCSQDWPCHDLPTTLLGDVGQTIVVDAKHRQQLELTRRPDGAVDIKWPYGWDYR